MRKLMFLGLVFMGVVNAGSVYESYHLFNEVMASGENVLNVFKKKEMEIVKVDVGRVSLLVKESVYKDLSKGYTYYISVAGQRSRIENLWAWVYYIDPTGKETLVGLDTMTEIYPRGIYPNIQVTPEFTGTYRVMVDVRKMVKGCDNGYYFMAIGALKH